MSKRKEFVVEVEDGKELKLCVKTPDYNDFEEADKIYASKIASLVKDNKNKRLLLRSQVDQFLKDTLVWTTEDETKVIDLNNQIDSLLTKMRRGGIKITEGRKICLEIADKRREMFNINRKRQIFDDSTIESMAETEKMDYLIFASVVTNENGQKYWDSFEDMKNDKLGNVYQRANIHVLEVVYGINTDFEKTLPENLWLQKNKFVDENLNFIDRKTGKKVDRDGNAVEEIEKQVLNRLKNIQGEIVEEVPFIDDET